MSQLYLNLADQGPKFFVVVEVLVSCWVTLGSQVEANCSWELDCMCCESRVAMEAANSIETQQKGQKTSKKSSFIDDKKPKKRKAPRYWSDKQENNEDVESVVEGKKEDVEEIVIDPLVLEKYTRGERLNIEVYFLLLNLCVTFGKNIFYFVLLHCKVLVWNIRGFSFASQIIRLNVYNFPNDILSYIVVYYVQSKFSF